MIKPWPWENMDEASGQRAQREHRQKAAFVGGTRPSSAVQGHVGGGQSAEDEAEEGSRC